MTSKDREEMLLIQGKINNMMTKTGLCSAASFWKIGSALQYRVGYFESNMDAVAYATELRQTCKDYDVEEYTIYVNGNLMENHNMYVNED